ncbi:MAG: tetratricopeptide repeat protein, partial [Deltaproteobacteria bacterium]|nr:tetratricopeptide repeat protein [Deltaproteobacteria bacterium]
MNLKAVFTKETINEKVASLCRSAGEYYKTISNKVDESLNKPEDNLESYRQKGEGLIQQKQYAQAIPRLLKVIELAPNDDIAHLLLGVAYLGINAVDKAVPAFNEAIRVNPHCSEAYLKLGLIHLANNACDKALDALLKAVAIDSKNAETHYRLGTVHDQMGHQDKAIE